MNSYLWQGHEIINIKKVNNGREQGHRGQRMEKTKLYLPYTDFTINDKQGEQRLLDALISNGPAYKVIVHESDEWHRIKDELLLGDRVEIISSKEADQIKEKVDRFFSPVIEDIP